MPPLSSPDSHLPPSILSPVLLPGDLFDSPSSHLSPTPDDDNPVIATVLPPPDDLTSPTSHLPPPLSSPLPSRRKEEPPPIWSPESHLPSVILDVLPGTIALFAYSSDRDFITVAWGLFADEMF